MKTKILLVLAGLLFGCLLAVPLLIIVPKYLMPAGSQFKSLGQLRSTLTQRDDHDQHDDGSVSLRSLLEPDSDDNIIYKLLPNLDVRFQSVPVHTNSFGMRQGEITQDKPPGTYRIALLGDSFAFGWGVEQKDSFAQVLEDQLNATHALPGKVEVLNFGVPGYSTFQEVAKLLQEDMVFKPDMVIVYFIDNDFGLPFFIGSGGGLLDSVSFVNRVWHTDTDNEALQQQDRDLLSRVDANRALLKLNKQMRARKIPLYLALNPSGTYDNDLKKLWAVRHSKYMKFIEIRDLITKKIDAAGYTKEQLKLPNDPHPSAIKQRLIGETMAEELTALVAQANAAATAAPVSP